MNNTTTEGAPMLAGVFTPTDHLRTIIARDAWVMIMNTYFNPQGTSRQVRVVVVGTDGRPLEVTGLVAVALEMRQGKHGIILAGGGMDTRYPLLCSLGEHLYGDADAFLLA
jgi:hypothetical protein